MSIFSGPGSGRQPLQGRSPRRGRPR
jgi:hypothetical protein